MSTLARKIKGRGNKLVFSRRSWQSQHQTGPEHVCLYKGKNSEKSDVWIRHTVSRRKNNHHLFSTPAEPSPDPIKRKIFFGCETPTIFFWILVTAMTFGPSFWVGLCSTRWEVVFPLSKGWADRWCLVSSGLLYKSLCAWQPRSTGFHRQLRLKGIFIRPALSIDIRTFFDQQLHYLRVTFFLMPPGGIFSWDLPWALISAPFSISSCIALYWCRRLGLST